MKIGCNMSLSYDVGPIIPFLENAGIIQRWDKILRAPGFQFQSIPDLLLSKDWYGGIRDIVHWFRVGDIEGEHCQCSGCI